MKYTASTTMQTDDGNVQLIRNEYLHALTHQASKNLIENHVRPNIRQILIYGCVNGGGTQLMQSNFPAARLYVADSEVNLSLLEQNHELVFHMTFSDIHTISRGSIDLVYSKLFFSQTGNLEGHLKLLHQKLSPGGLLVIEDIQFDESHCSPSNFVFQQGLELFAQLKKIQGIDSSNLESILSNLESRHCNISQVIYHRPTFLIGQNRHMLSMGIHARADLVIKHKLMSEDKLGQFLLLLNKVEADEEHILTLPGIYQIVAQKQE